MSYLSDSPQVTAYRQGEAFTSLNQHYPLYNNNSNASSFNRPREDKPDAYPAPPPPPLNRYGESQVEAVFIPVAAQTRQINSNVPLAQVQYGNPQTGVNGVNRGSNFTYQDRDRESGSKFDNYLNSGIGKSYKYNIFSVIDEPWNRCTGGQSCTSSTGNECIADQNVYNPTGPRQYL